ncbi:hypothetical protein FH608_020855 [Nonomuraea phyllanthi]|uniref:FtsX-like permease family protein n=1 Tax=Nonomuraea phyllanthi TaxID=2219224 RepID=A0A5C4WF53_9ACTN|nr:hypothetical protein [Nonomuraea phyllanthi]KAB8193667.1 hypothetical protein FH608_020855 [Nonomuraea phyllanthi]
MPWGPVLGVAALGVVSGLTAAVVPAIQASRQSPVQVLSGRAAVDLPGRAGRPVLGAALVLLGLAANAFALHRGTLSVLVAAVPLVFGLVALVPWLVQVTGRLAGRLPLPLRLSVRDAARHRVRTSSATAAVMAATMGVVAVGIGFQSLYAQREAERPLAVPAGTTTITAGTLDEQKWAALREFARAELRGANLVSGLAATDAQGNSVTVSVAYQTVLADDPAQHRYYVPMPVGDARLLAFLQGGHDARAAAALAAGQVVVFDPSLVRDGTVELRASWDDGTTPARTLRVPAVVARAGSAAQGGALVPEPVLARAGLKAVERVLYADEVPADPSRLDTKVRATFGDRVFSVVQEGLDRSHLMVMLILLAAALVLVLGGTFAATGLAAADMRQDLDTLSAVGGPPLVRRLVVAAQAACVSGLGALVGLAGGTVSGIALTWPLTRSSGAELLDPGPTVIAIPWALLAWVVVGLPALAALVAGLCARTRPALARRMA